MTGCTELKRLTCSHNKLTNLDITGCIELENLRCFNNKLTNLDMTGYIALKHFDCSYNKLTGLSLGGCIALVDLCCINSKLTSLSVSGCTALSVLDCSGNELTSDALDTLFGTLHSAGKPTIFGKVTKLFRDNYYRGTISITGNPGEKTCNRKIAEKKGWAFQLMIFRRNN
jgi:Leucine-rich repeat (LRR) protein